MQEQRLILSHDQSMIVSDKIPSLFSEMVVRYSEVSDILPDELEHSRILL